MIGWLRSWWRLPRLVAGLSAQVASVRVCDDCGVLVALGKLGAAGEKKDGTALHFCKFCAQKLKGRGLLVKNRA